MNIESLIAIAVSGFVGLFTAFILFYVRGLRTELRDIWGDIKGLREKLQELSNDNARKDEKLKQHSNRLEKLNGLK